MTKKLVAFRIEESLWEEFLRLVDESDRSAQDVLRECVKACLEARSTEVKLLSRDESGRDLSNELSLRNTLLTLQECINQGDHATAEFRFSDLTDEVRDIRDPALLKEARVVATYYLKWLEDRNLKTLGDNQSND